MSDYRNRIRELTETTEPVPSTKKTAGKRRAARILLVTAVAAAATAVFFVGRAEGWWTRMFSPVEPAPVVAQDPGDEAEETEESGTTETAQSESGPPGAAATRSGATGSASGATGSASGATGSASGAIGSASGAAEAAEATEEAAAAGASDPEPASVASEPNEPATTGDSPVVAESLPTSEEDPSPQAASVAPNGGDEATGALRPGTINTPTDAGPVLGGAAVPGVAAVGNDTAAANDSGGAAETETPSTTTPVIEAVPLVLPGVPDEADQQPETADADPQPAPAERDSQPAAAVVVQEPESPDVSDLRPAPNDGNEAELSDAPVILPAVARARATEEEEPQGAAAPRTPNPILSDLVLVPAGSFRFGGLDDEGVLVEVEAFYMETHEVTNAQYKAFLDATDYPSIPISAAPGSSRYDWDAETGTFPEGTANHPVVNVSLADARAYAEWAGRRLPTEVEWEFAAESGVAESEDATFPWPGPFADRRFANFDSGSLQPIKQYPSNSLGLYDLGGNAFEWTDSAYSRDPAARLVSGTALPRAGEGSDDVGVLRGGAFYSTFREVQIDYREANYADINYFGYGFRCVRDIDPAADIPGQNSDDDKGAYIRVGVGR